MSLTVFRVFINFSTILYSSINATLTNPVRELAGDAYAAPQPFGLFHQLLFSARAVTRGLRSSHFLWAALQLSGLFRQLVLSEPVATCRLRPSHFLSAALQFSGLLLQCLFLEGVSACRFRPSHFLSGKERLERRS